MINLWCYHEGWTSDCCNNLGWTVVSGEMPIELRYILFSAKVILVMFSLHKFGVKLYFILHSCIFEHTLYLKPTQVVWRCFYKGDWQALMIKGTAVELSIDWICWYCRCYVKLNYLCPCCNYSATNRTLGSLVIPSR